MISGDNRIEAGMLAVSRAGHDCGKTYVIIKADSRFVWLADGSLRKVSDPKKKSRKHIQVIRRTIIQLPITAADEKVKRILKEYLAEQRTAAGSHRENQEDCNVKSRCH